MDSNLSREQLRLEIDADIRELESKLADLRTKRNALSLAMKLPAELWGSIFNHCRESAKGGYGYMNPNLRWLPVITVCRRWREITLNTPYLWSTISITWDHQALVEVLDRSGNAPVSLQMMAGGSSSSALLIKAVSLVMGHIDRLEELDICADDEYITKVTPLLNKPAPALRKLTLSDPDSCEDEDEELDLNMLCGQAPSLRDVTIVGFRINMGSSFFSGLTKLDITRYDSRPSAEEFFGALTACPSIQELSLQGACPEHTTGFDPTRRDGERIWLKVLKLLRIQDNQECLSYFFSCSNIPGSTEMHIVVVLDDETKPAHEFPRLLYPLMDAMAPASSPHACKMVHVSNAPRSLSSDAGSSTRNVRIQWNRAAEDKYDSSLTVASGNPRPSSTSNLRSLALHTCAVLPLQRALLLEFGYSQLRASDIARAFSHASNLETVKAHGSCIKAVLGALCGQ